MNFEDEESSTASSPSSPLPIVSHKRKARRKKFKVTRHSVYRGVRRRNGNKWVCEVRKPNKNSRIWLGTLPSPEMAARAHDVAALALRGPNAHLNFLTLPRSFPRAKSASAWDIRLSSIQKNSVVEPIMVDSSNFESHAIDIEHFSSDSTCVEGSNSVFSDPLVPVFVDEEALFNMPALLDSMAEGLLLTPPAMKTAFNWGDMDDGQHMDLILW